MDEKDPFGTVSWVTYASVVGLASVAGALRHLNGMRKFHAGRFLIDVMSAGFTGLLTYWICLWQEISGPLMAFFIAVSGLMGSRIWKEWEALWRNRMLGFSNPTPVNPPVLDEPESVDKGV